MVIVGCSMLVSAVQNAKTAPRSSYGNGDVGEGAGAMREGRTETADRILREIDAERERGYSSYDRPSASRPHFKPGEPMIDPNPTSRYGN